MAIWLVADWHFEHDREFIYKPRGFSSIEEMNEAIIERHNSVVAPDDDPNQIKNIEEIDNSQCPLDTVLNWNGEIKWYSHEEDMMEIAAQFPECIFVLDGDGEERGDQWRMYLHGDKFFKTWAQVTYEKPDWM